MSDADMAMAAESATDASASEHNTAPEPTAGALLRQAREAAGMHIAALAVSLKVPVKKLEALEQDRFELLPDAVFVRALASSVCRSLKLDAAPVLERLPQTTAPKLTYHKAGINTPFRSPGEGPRPTKWTHLSKPAVVAVLALLLGALVLIFLPVLKPDTAKGDGDQAGGAEAVKPLPAAVAITGAGPVNDAPAAFPTPQTNENTSGTGSVVTSGSPPSSPPTASLPGSALPAIQPAPASVSGSAVTPAASPASSAAPSGIVVFRAKGASWVEVTDAKGTVVLRRTLAAGEVAGVSGALPLAAVVGKADVTQVQIRGQAFDLGSVARDNVARFEVK
ncbi:RodZ domain-containing protein [Polaromonas sp.]|uniref:helix-turn-helix domain-containing protein n=1 Tax=Polaromonas sp. TaxID=1869339 RepID=UPI00326690A2